VHAHREDVRLGAAEGSPNVVGRNLQTRCDGPGHPRGHASQVDAGERRAIILARKQSGQFGNGHPVAVRELGKPHPERLGSAPPLGARCVSPLLAVGCSNSRIEFVAAALDHRAPKRRRKCEGFGVRVCAREQCSFYGCREILHRDLGRPVQLSSEMRVLESTPNARRRLGQAQTRGVRPRHEESRVAPTRAGRVLAARVISTENGGAFCFGGKPFEREFFDHEAGDDLLFVLGLQGCLLVDRSKCGSSALCATLRPLAMADLVATSLNCSASAPM